MVLNNIYGIIGIKLTFREVLIFLTKNYPDHEATKIALKTIKEMEKEMKENKVVENDYELTVEEFLARIDNRKSTENEVYCDYFYEISSELNGYVDKSHNLIQYDFGNNSELLGCDCELYKVIWENDDHDTENFILGANFCEIKVCQYRTMPFNIEKLKDTLKYEEFEVIAVDVRKQLEKIAPEFVDKEIGFHFAVNDCPCCS